MIILGVFTPGFLAVLLTYFGTGRSGVVLLLRRLVAWRVATRWYVFALTYIAAVKLTAAVLLRLTTGVWPTFGKSAWYVLLGATLASALSGGQIGEELGWRGYALPRLANHFGMLVASLILGLLWASWHLPLFYVLGGDTVGQSFPLYLLQVTAVSVAMAWLYWKTNGSLLLTMLFHAAANNLKDIVPSAVPGATHPWRLSTSPVAWLAVGLMWAAAGYFLFDLRAGRTR
jgi:membrane protease YdiL (CAAX protease family)